ncbi:MAG: hypothetical protein K8R77_03970, partial [Anaerolineaceae bacterium]|nr:hypothetical protein [Anaerolineaceae bacterium]
LGISVFVTETTNGSIAYISSKWFDRNEISSVKKRKRDYSSNQPSKYKETIWNKNSKSGKAFISVLEFVNNIENSKIEFE